MSQSVERNQISHSRHHASFQSNKESQKLTKGCLDAYQIGKPIGQGAYAMVYSCYCKLNMKKYAIKIYQKSKLNDSMKRKAV